MADSNGNLIGLFSQATPNGFKQGTVQVFLNGQLLTEGVDWQEAVSHISLNTPPSEGEAVKAIKLKYTGNLSDSYVIYAVKHSDEIEYGY